MFATVSIASYYHPPRPGDARARISVDAAALDARRDFNLAAVELRSALTIGGEVAAGGEPAMQ